MAETDTQTEPSRVLDPRVMQAFNEAGLPYKIDMQQVDDPTKFFEAPFVQDILEKNNAEVIYNHEIRAIVDEPKRVIEEAMKIGKEGKLSLERLQQVDRALDNLYDGLREKTPQLYAFVKTALDADRLEELKQSYEGTSFNGRHGALLERAAEANAALAFVKDVLRPNMVGTAQPVNYTETNENGEEISYNFDKFRRYVNVPSAQEGMAEVVKDTEKRVGIKLPPPPGTTAQQAAVVWGHEVGHIAGDPLWQSADYFSAVLGKVTEKMQNPEDIEAMMRNLDRYEKRVHNGIEIDADLETQASIGGKVPEQLMDYRSALGMLSAHGALVQLVQNNEHPMAVSNDDAHAGMSFALELYRQTEELPRYEELLPAVNGFYAKTAEKFNDIKGEELGRSGLGALNDLDGQVSIPIALGIAKQGLTAEPELYSPAEAQMAQIFIERMEGTLEIEPQDARAAIRATIGLIQPVIPEVTGDPTAPK